MRSAISFSLVNVAFFPCNGNDNPGRVGMDCSYLQLRKIITILVNCHGGLVPLTIEGTFYELLYHLCFSLKGNFVRIEILNNSMQMLKFLGEVHTSQNRRDGSKMNCYLLYLLTFFLNFLSYTTC